MKNIFPKTILIGLALAATTAANAAPPTFSRFASIDEATILPATVGPKTDADFGGLAVDASGNVYVTETDGTGGGTEAILKITPGGVVSQLVTAATISTALDTANGTLTNSDFNVRQLAMAADGDLIVLGFVTSANLDALVSVNTATGTPTVVYTPVNSGDSAIDGSGALTVIGNTAYVATDATNGPAAAVYSINTNDGAAPAAVVTTVVTQSALTTFFGASAPVANDAALNALANNGTLIYGIASNTSAAPDDVISINPVGGALATVATKGSLLPALSAAAGSAITDTGYGAIAVDNAGRIWLANSFGQGVTDDTIIRINPDTSVDVVLESALLTQLSTGSITMTNIFFANDSLYYDATGNRVFYAEGSENPTGAETIAVTAANSAVTEWTTYE